MKRIFYFFLFFTVSSLITACNHMPAPTLDDLQGNHINLADYHNKWILVNYWASWCKPCWQETPALNAFYAAHKDKDAVLFGVNFDQIPLEQQRIDSHRMGIEFPVLVQDPAKIFDFKPVTGLPTTFLINPQGKLHRVLFGEQTQASLEKAMQRKGSI